MARREVSAAMVSVMQVVEDRKYWSQARLTRSLAAACSCSSRWEEGGVFVPAADAMYLLAVMNLRHSFLRDRLLASCTEQLTMNPREVCFGWAQLAQKHNMRMYIMC